MFFESFITDVYEFFGDYIRRRRSLTTTTAQAIVRELPTYFEATGNFWRATRRPMSRRRSAEKSRQVNFDIGSYVRKARCWFNSTTATRESARTGAGAGSAGRIERAAGAGASRSGARERAANASALGLTEGRLSTSKLFRKFARQSAA
jgi:hypothetical protein